MPKKSCKIFRKIAINRALKFVCKDTHTAKLLCRLIFSSLRYKIFQPNCEEMHGSKYENKVIYSYPKILWLYMSKECFLMAQPIQPRLSQQYTVSFPLISYLGHKGVHSLLKSVFQARGSDPGAGLFTIMTYMKPQVFFWYTRMETRKPFTFDMAHLIIPKLCSIWVTANKHLFIMFYFM